MGNCVISFSVSADTGLANLHHIIAEVTAPMAEKRGPHWKLAPHECSQLGHAYGAVIDKYFPSLHAGPELTAVLISVTVLGPRVMKDLAAGKPAGKTAAPEPVDPDIVHKGGPKKAPVHLWFLADSSNDHGGLQSAFVVSSWPSCLFHPKGDIAEAATPLWILAVASTQACCCEPESADSLVND